MAASFPQIACLVVLSVAFLAQNCEAITCSQVQGAAIPCLNYLRSGGPVPANCCNGIRTIYNSAKASGSVPIACRCLLAIAKAVPGFNYGSANALPGQCGVSLPYKLSPNLDCSKVH